MQLGIALRSQAYTGDGSTSQELHFVHQFRQRPSARHLPPLLTLFNGWHEHQRQYILENRSYGTQIGRMQTKKLAV